MKRRRRTIALEITAGVLAVVVIVVGVAIWRLSQGPVDLDVLTPRLEASLSNLEETVDVEIGGTVLTWAGWPRTFALRANDVTVRSEGAEAAHLPAIDVQLSLSALLSGTLAPTAFTAHGLYLTIIRDEEGFHLGKPGDTVFPEPEVIIQITRELLDDLMAAPDPARRLSYLDSLGVDDVRLTVEDTVLNTRWLMPDARLALRRTEGGLTGEGEMNVILNGEPVPLDAALSYAASEERLDVAATIRGLRPAAVAEGIPGLAPAAGITVPLNATVTGSTDLTGQLGPITADVVGGGGSLAIPDVLPEAVPVRSLAGRARFDPSEDRVAVDDLRIDLGTADAPGPRLAGTLSADALSGDPRLSLRGHAEDILADDLGSYWPSGLAPPAREWVTENIRSGIAQSATLHLDMTIPGGDIAAARLDALSGDMAFGGMDVHYLRPLPPAREVNGTAHFDKDSFRVRADSGSHEGIRIPRASVDITGLGGADQYDMVIDFDAEGPLRDVLHLLDHPEFALTSELGVDPQRTSGTGRANVVFAFPLLLDLAMDDVAIEVEADLADVALSGFMLGRDATGERLALTLDENGMVLSGPMALGGIPLQMSWQQRFADEGRDTSQMSAQIPELDGDARAKLGLNLSPYLDGPISAALVSRTAPNGRGEIRAAVNLRDAGLYLPGFGWRKDAGQPGEATLAVRTEGDSLESIESFAIRAEGNTAPLDARGAVRFAGDGRSVSRLTLDTLSLGGTSLRDVTAEQRDGAWEVSADGGRLDASGFLATWADGETGAGEDARPSIGVPLLFRGRSLSEVRFAEGRRLTDVDVDARREADGRWTRLDLGAGIPKGLDGTDRERLTVRYGPREDGRRELLVESSATGDALRALNVLDSMNGGHLRLEGVSRTAEPDSAIDATLDLREFTLVDAPILAQLLTLGSLTGIGDRLRGGGISFQELSGEISLHDGVVTSDLLHAYGPSLGITAKGRVALREHRADLEGALVPAASINRVLGNIPLVGGFITGGEGQGVIAMRYTLRGPLDDPQVAVNPLSALTPGFLRGIFGFLGDAEPGVTASEPPDPPQTQSTRPQSATQPGP